MIPLRVLHAVGDVATGPHGEGAAILAAWLRFDGHEVALAVREDHASGFDPFDAPVIPWRRGRLGWWCGGAASFARRVGAWTPDVVHAHGAEALAPAIDLARRLNLPLLAQVHARPDGRTLTLLRHPRVTWVLAGTESVRSDLVTRCGLPRDRVTLLPFAVEPPNAASRAIGRQFVLGLDLRVAGGRIETVCEALARAIAGGLDARLLVATGDVRVRAVITAAATAHGLASRLRIEDLDARALVQRCDGLAHADSDAVPALAVLAALAARVPAVVASDCGVLELVREAVLAVPADDVGALAEALHQVAEPDRRRTLAHAGQELARTRFAVDVVGEAAVGLYRGAIGDRGDPGAKAETATLYRRISGLRSGTTPPPGTISR